MVGNLRALGWRTLGAEARATEQGSTSAGVMVLVRSHITIRALTLKGSLVYGAGRFAATIVRLRGVSVVVRVC